MAVLRAEGWTVASSYIFDKLWDNLRFLLGQSPLARLEPDDFDTLWAARSKLGTPDRHFGWCLDAESDSITFDRHHHQDDIRTDADFLPYSSGQDHYG
jgi:hypothetical protein